MTYKADIEIAQDTNMSKIGEIVSGLGLDEKHVEQYGPYKAKLAIACSRYDRQAGQQTGSGDGHSPHISG